MKVFVAGATGVLGRRAVPLLIASGHDVTGVARSEDKAGILRSAGAQPVRVDLFDPDAVRRAVAGHDAVVNLATSIPPTSRAMLRSAWRANDRLRTEAAAHLAEAAITTGAPRVVQESITFPYEDGGARWLTESAPIDAAGVLASAPAAEAAAERVTAQGGIGVVLRFALLVAAESSHTREMMTAARKGLLPLLGTGRDYESFVDADDAAAVVVAALTSPAGIYNVAEDDPATNAEHAEALAAAVGRSVRRPPAVLGRLPRVSLRARSQRVSNRALRDATDWRPATSRLVDDWARVLAATEVGRAA